MIKIRGGCMGVKNNLKEIRMREYMMSSSEFVKFLEVPLSTYSQWENGSNNPPLAKAFEITKKLNRKLEDIWYSE
jgi:putative transcriptional regulator